MRKTLVVFLILWILGIGNWLRSQDPPESSKIAAPDSPQQPEQPIPFPSSEEFRPKSKIQLVRHGCYGSCPQYTVTIFGNGKVIYQGAEFVRIKGHAKTTISRKAVDDLIAKINKMDFFTLQPKRAQACVEDGPHAGITISEPGRQKEIEDQCLEGNEVEELEKAIDKAAQTQQWIFINAREMQNEIDRGWDVTEHGEEYARQAIDWDDPEILQVLIKNGVPVETQDQQGRTLLLEAVSRNRYELAKTLLELGANPKARDKDGWGLAQGAGASSVEMCKLLLAHGATIDGQDGFGRTMLMYASWTGNLETVQFLLSLGANVNLRSKEGKTAVVFAQGLRQQYQGMVDFTSRQDYPKFLGDPKAARAVYMETVRRCDAVIEYLRQHGAAE